MPALQLQQLVLEREQHLEALMCHQEFQEEEAERAAGKELNCEGEQLLGSAQAKQREQQWGLLQVLLLLMG
jgi:hypothetical protein